MQLSDDELRDVLTRAEEIQRSSRTAGTMQSEIAAVIEAGEAVGLARPALERALRERLELVPAVAVTTGSLVFAESADGKYYIAEVISAASDSVRVRFKRGSEHTVTPEQVRPAAFLPGEQVMVDWPWWGPWKCTVVSYDAERHLVNLSDGWADARYFDISEVWQAPRKPSWRSGKVRVYATWLSVGAGIGALIGSAITALLMR